MTRGMITVITMLVVTMEHRTIFAISVAPRCMRCFYQLRKIYKVRWESVALGLKTYTGMISYRNYLMYSVLSWLVVIGSYRRRMGKSVPV